MTENKVQYGLNNMTIIPFTDSGTDIVYKKAIPYKGAVSISLDPAGDVTSEYADNGLWFQLDNNQGFTGKMSMENLPLEVSTIILGDVADDNGVIAQSKVPGESVAIAFQFQGDKKATRHILYNVGFKRAAEGSATKADKLEIKNFEFEFTAGLDPYLEVAKAKTNPDTAETVYENWFTTPYRPTFSA
ncbi:MAG: phage tail protein [Lactobacillaceae bacterium]|jgi:phi13 family phage major tail protein|nr:phage tail protein [Lactobacillaceae bacterium]